jgi:squalene-hopene/tetraprenyl-beta-curcumene cyclase
MAAGLVEDKAVTLGVPYLTRTQAEDGFWKEERFTATGFPRVFFLRYHGYAKYFPLWAMARFRNLKKGNRHPVLVECDRLPGHRRHRP